MEAGPYVFVMYAFTLVVIANSHCQLIIPEGPVWGLF